MGESVSDGFRLGRVDSTPSLKHKAYASIKDAILTLKLEPGAALVEGELAEQLGISKTPVRDALQELEREGFVTRVLFKGTYVTDVTMSDMTEVFQLRAVLEGLAARLAAPHFSQADLKQLELSLTRAEVALAQGDLALCSQLGQAIHLAIIDKAGNDRLAWIIHNLDDHLRRFRILSDRINGRLNRSVQEHRRILAGLEQRDSAGAEQAMRNHLFSVLQDLSTPDESSR